MPAPRLALTLALVALFTPTARAQFPRHGLTSVHPSGGQAGTTVTVEIAGPETDGAVQLVFDHPAIRAFRIKGPKFAVAIGPGVPLGTHDVRLSGPLGLSNARTFEVGSRPETVETEPNNDPAKAAPVALGETIRGRIDVPTDVDSFAFEGRRGQKLIAEVATESLDTRLDAAFRLIAPSGRMLIGPSDLPGPEPVLTLSLPEEGRYVLQVHDVVFGGSPDHGYRLSLREGPHIDAAEPVPPDGAQWRLAWRDGGGPAEPLSEALARHRPSHRATIPGRMFGTSDRLTLAFGAVPLARPIAESEPNDRSAGAPAISPPCEVIATFGTPGDVDVFPFHARKGDVWAVDVLADRIGTDVDAELSIRRIEPGKPPVSVVASDDPVDPFAGKRFPAATRDPEARFTAPEDGTYEVVVRDRNGSPRAGGRTLPYRIRLRDPRPDFDLFLVPRDATNPEATTLRAGGRASAVVMVHRRDGLTGPIRVEAIDLPGGVSCDPVVIGADQVMTSVVFSAEPGTAPLDRPIRLVGRNLSGGRKEALAHTRGSAPMPESEHEAIPGGLIWTAPTGTADPVPIAQARTTSEFPLAIRDGAPFRLAATPGSAVVGPGDSLEIRIDLIRNAGFVGDVALTVADLPAGIPAPAAVTIAKDKTTATLTLKIPKEAKPGLATIHLRGTGPFPFSKDPAAKEKPSITADEPSNSILLTVRP